MFQYPAWRGKEDRKQDCMHPVDKEKSKFLAYLYSLYYLVNYVYKHKIRGFYCDGHHLIVHFSYENFLINILFLKGKHLYKIHLF